MGENKVLKQSLRPLWMKKACVHAIEVRQKERHFTKDGALLPITAEMKKALLDSVFASRK